METTIAYWVILGNLSEICKLSSDLTQNGYRREKDAGLATTRFTNVAAINKYTRYAVEYGRHCAALTCVVAVYAVPEAAIQSHGLLNLKVSCHIFTFKPSSMINGHAYIERSLKHMQCSVDIDP